MASHAISSRHVAREHARGGKAQPVRPGMEGGPRPAINWSLSGPSVAQHFGMDEHSIAQRREYVRLSEEDRELLSGMVPWIASVASEISRGFYDWQFTFGPTREFFESFARTKEMPVTMLRERLEATHAGYLIEVFAGAEINWDLRYFEKRLRVQTVHDRIQLPFKWFVGAYAEFTRLIGERLRRDFRDVAKIYRVETALQKVFNFDIQAMSDAATLNTLEGVLRSIGLGLDATEQRGDLADHVEEIKHTIEGDLRGHENSSVMDALQAVLKSAGIRCEETTGDKAEKIACFKEIIHGQIEQFTSALHTMFAEHEKGNLDYQMPAESFKGVFHDMAVGVNEMRSGHIELVHTVMGCVDQFGKGNFEARIQQYPGQRAFINETIEQVRANLKGLIADTDELIGAAVGGRLSTRADAAKHPGDFGKIVDGINRTLDAVIRPLQVTADYVRRIAVGDIPPKITDSYNGDFNEIKEDLNTCIGALSGLLAEMKHMSDEHNKGDIDVRMPIDKFQGEYHTMAQGVNEMVAGHIEVKKKAMACVAEFGKGNFKAPLERFPGKKAFINDAIEEMRHNLTGLISETSENASTLASSAEELTAVSHQMAGTAEETATQANVVSAASEQISRNVATVASSSEQMQASIREISKNANESARVAKNAVSVAHATNTTMKKLGDSSQEIGNVIKVITSIAQQTNLLALNATIEAARAGEAGKGFAVVANEVKELAKQTARATEEIGKKIEAIQGDTTGAVKAISEIGTIIDQINEISNSIASAVEEQTVTTNEIGRSVAEAAKGVGDIAKNISGVAVAAKSTTEGAADTQKASEELSRMAARLQTVLSKFTV